MDNRAKRDIARELPKQIRKKIKRMGEWPDEIHFYDDAPQNTIAVANALDGKIPSEVHIYGPGDFHGGKVSLSKPTQTINTK